MEDDRWIPLVAEREASLTSAPTIVFPCLGPYNRYTGCIGARQCRARGVARCRLGRWPDERAVPLRHRPLAIDDELVADVALPVSGPVGVQAMPPPPSSPPRSSSPRPAARPSPPARVATAASVLPVVLVSTTPRLRRSLVAHLTAGGHPVMTPKGAGQAQAILAADGTPAALLVDADVPAAVATGLLAAAQAVGVPALSLPALDRGADPTALAQMAIVWLASVAAHATPAAKAG